MKELDPVRQLEILKETYITVNMIYELYPFGKTNARKLAKQIVVDLKKKDIPILPGKEMYVPTSEVLKRYPINKKALEEYVLMQKKNAPSNQRESV